LTGYIAGELLPGLHSTMQIASCSIALVLCRLHCFAKSLDCFELHFASKKTSKTLASFKLHSTLLYVQTVLATCWFLYISSQYTAAGNE